jgi:malonyl CoA-acyl carrier protein transacylase
MKTYVFPGQGAQAKGMGGALFDEFAELTKVADKVLGYSIKELCLENPRRELNKTQFTQSALYVVNALTYFKQLAETGQKPDFVAGHSLGEFNALLAAECFDFEAGLKLVKRRGELMSQAVDGGMAAILNASKAQIEDILHRNGLSNIDLANYNTPSQIVISGAMDEIEKAQTLFTEGEMLYYPLNTSGAFHSRFMQASSEKYADYLKTFKFAEPTIQVISNVTARPYKTEDIVANLSNQIASPVRWSDSVRYLMRVAAEAGETMEFLEIGYGDALTKMIATIRQESPQLTVVSKPAAPPLGAPQETATQARQSGNDSTTPRGLVEAERLVRQWNQQHPVGTRVRSLTLDYQDLETRTEAVVLFGHRAAVYMKDYNGYFDLKEIVPL